LAKEIIIRKINECFVRLIVLDNTLENNLIKHFRVKDPNCNFKPHFKKNGGFWDGYDYFYKKQILPIGFLYKLEKYCVDNKISLKYNGFVDTNDVTVEDISEYLESLKQKGELQKTPHDYQLMSVYDSLINRRNIVVIGTSGGKSFTIYAVTRFCLKEKCKVLIIVPQKTLVDQLYANFLEYGWDNVGIHTQKRHSEIAEKRIIKDVVITTWQSVYKKIDALRQFDAVIVDEVQCAKGKEVAGLLGKCENAVVRIGFTGTMYDEDSYDYMHVVSNFGKPKIYADYAKLRGDERISNFEVIMLALEYPLEVKEQILITAGKNYFEENEAVIMSRGRNLFILNHEMPNNLTLFNISILRKL
jgi:superfamily II DNA or RNA helicase